MQDLQAALTETAALSRRLQVDSETRLCEVLSDMLRDAASSTHAFVIALPEGASSIVACRSPSAAPWDSEALRRAAEAGLDGIGAGAVGHVECHGVRFALIPMSADGQRVLGALGLSMDDDLRLDAAMLARLAGQGAARLEQLRAAERKAREIEPGPLTGEGGMLRTLIDLMPDHIYAKDCNGRFILGNKAAALSILGVPDPGGLIGKSDLDFYPIECGQRFFTDEQEIIRTGEPIIDQVEENLIKGGPLRYFSTTKFPFRDRHGTIAGIVGISRDITLRVGADQVAKLRDRAVESSQDGIVITGNAAQDYPIVYINPAFERITGFALEEAQRSGIERFLLEEGEPVQGAVCRDELIARHGQRRVLRSWRKDGSQFWSEVRLAVIRSADGVATHHVFTVVDVTAAQRAEEELVLLASHDALTGLPNRRMLMERLAQAASAGLDGGLQLAVAFIDLDGLKRLNDEQGHEAGDALLRAVAERVSGCIRKSDMIARLGGDEFVLVTLHRTDHAGGDPEGVNEVLHKIRERIAQPLAIGDAVVHPSCSIGVALFGQHGTDPDTLLRRADEAMYVAKKSGRHRLAFATAP